ncbi:MAG: SDR family NAD(P)-dependent oxidoreductase [Chloroflexota bacterium]
MRLDGKVAVITGAAQGIGRGIAHRFAEEGASVVVADIQQERGQATTDELTAKGAKAAFIHTDVTEAEQIERMIAFTVERYGRLDVVVNDAYWNKGGTAIELELADWNKALAAMVTAHYLAAKYAVPHLERAGGGSMISISSVHGLLAAARGVAYETAKGALILLVKQMAVDFGPLGIRVNAICPGLIVHEGQRNPAWQQDPFRSGLQQMNYPLRRWGTPLDIANAALYLASDEASFVTGHALVVDGGMTVQLQDSHSQRVVQFVREHLPAT